MDSNKLSHSFYKITYVWKLLGMWSGKSSSKYLRIYSGLFVTLFCILFNFFFTFSLVYAPRAVDTISVGVYYFTTLCELAEVLMILRNRQKIISVFETMDCKEFQGNDRQTNEYLRQFKTTFSKYLKVYAAFIFITSNICLISLPLFNYFFRQKELNMPIWEYYFLNNETRNKYFFYLFIYQSLGMEITLLNHIFYNVFLSGILSVAVIQSKILNWNIANIRLADEDVSKSTEEKERLYLNKIYDCLKHYEIILKYCEDVQDLTNFLISLNYGLSVLTLCFTTYMFLLATTNTNILVYMGLYLSAMLVKIFVPSFLGSQLTNETNNLRFAVYSCDWVPRSKAFKTCLMILVERAHRPVFIKGLKVVPLSLVTFTSIVKTAYSFYTLLKGAQDQLA
ncbi:hypothetical protein ABMA27_006901 [Loxostege sticticalis]|uniref:Odorant receptor n=1 Tax=Loxostege sticticalis TaxID=481309 RepID=A0ABR3IKX3_LOXSC